MKAVTILLLIALIKVTKAVTNDALDQDMSKSVLMVVGGEPDEDHIGQGNIPELIDLSEFGGDLDRATYKCPDELEPLPEQFARSFPMAKMLDKVVACPKNRCYSYEPNSNNWLDFADLGADYEDAVTTAANDVWLMGPAQMERTTSLLLAESGELINDFIDLPQRVPRIEKGCAVTRSSLTYLIGGTAAIGDINPDPEVSRMAHQYDHLGGRWYSLPDMNVPRVALGCGFIIDEENGFQLVAVGGADGLNETETVSAQTYEIYDQIKSEWTLVVNKNLTEKLYFPASVQADETFFLVGGTSEPQFEDAHAVSHDIYYYDLIEGGLKKMEQKLDIGRKGPGAVMVPPELVGCKKN